MRPSMMCCLLWLPSLATASRSAVLPRLRDALTSSSRPLLVELLDAGPVDAMDAEELSTSCRKAGAAALLLPASMLGPVAAEQALADGCFPGPLPLVCDLRRCAHDALAMQPRRLPLALRRCMLATCTCSQRAHAMLTACTHRPCAGMHACMHVRAPLCLRSADLAELPAGDLADLHSSGASAVAFGGAAFVDLGDAAAADLVAGARQAGLDVLALVGSPTDGASAEAAGACAVVYETGADRPEPNGAADDVDSSAVRIDSWEGDEEGLYALREQGAGALLLRDACDGSVYYGTDRCTSLIRLAQSKQSLVYGGSMFGTVGDNAPPEQRNPRMWAQSKRQSREIMHESAKSRGLPPPKLKK